jgi:hypothetical protein
MAIVLDTHTFVAKAAAVSHTQSHTISDSAKIVAMVVSEAPFEPTGVTFDGNALTEIGTVIAEGNLRGNAYYYDSALSAGAYDLVVTYGGSRPCKIYIESMIGAATGLPEDHGKDSETLTTVVGDGFDLTASAGAFLMAISSCSTPTDTATVSSDVTVEEGPETSDSHATYTANAAGVLSGTKSIDWTWGLAAPDKIAMALSIGEAASGGMQLVGGAGLVG